ncbi:LytTR family two component transcriptional regulator [Chitinophaga skermanii]|uniref:LytTR family two component transcriptional regulator n=1 Tax=Chitinophaga skermanii TaxID=331697 RepID=A0A327QY32_9BACT|nr:LytTR family DNA-binding domain-containing protein [Chitinophaga skermanii]RAJ08522.1 LytTR family two component transcriptional regulator [Chitinophaga skermanii]
MNPLRCIIVDDEPLPIQLLSEYVGKTPFLHLEKTFSNPLEALAFVNHTPCDLVLLDIQMPELTGIQFLQMLPPQVQVILTTAYADYALQGYDLNVTDYLMKPISFDRFLKAVNKAMQRNQGAVTPAPVKVEPTPIMPEEVDVLFVKTDYKIVKIAVPEIMFIEGKKEYISINTTNGHFLTLQNMKRMEELLPNRKFIRVHKSFIVSIDRIDAIERNRIFIGHAVIPIGDTYRDAFFQLIGSGS